MIPNNKKLSKVVEFEDKDIKFILLERGTYLIDGEIVTTTGYDKTRVGVKNENDVRIVSTTTVVDHYVNTEDNSTITESEYIDISSELTKHRTYDEYDDCIWDSLEDEFNYRKFMQVWKRVDKKIQTVSEPILVEKVKAKYDTGNKFIVNAYLNGDKEHDLYIYNRAKAYEHIVEECFNELKMSFEGDCGYNYTKNKKVWGNSAHSGIRYVVAFGTYVFDDRFKNTSPSKGTLEDMVKEYERGRNSIRKVIRTGYNTAFGNIDDGKIDFKLMLNDLYALRGNINSIEAKKNSWSSQNNANRKVNEIISYLENQFE